jgi:hypothetical protein
MMHIRSHRGFSILEPPVGFLAAVCFLCLSSGESLRADDPALSTFREQALSLLNAFPASPEVDAASAAIVSAATFREVDGAALPLTLASVAINPEARVKIASAPDRVELIAGEPRRFLVRVENLAGVMAPLRLRGLDLASPDADEASWLRLRFVDSASQEASLATAPLHGTTDEYLAVELLVAEPGVREIRLVADAGQGTQDLGFRATADVQVRTRSADASPP